MDCDKCRRPAIIYQRYSGMHLCTRHFQEDWEKKAKRTIRKHTWIHPGDRIGIAISGGIHSTALACFLSSVFLQRRDIDLIALTIDAGIPGDRDPVRARDLAQSLGIPWYMTSCQDVSGDTLGRCLQYGEGKVSRSGRGLLPVQGLAALAAEHGVTRVALGCHLDDCSVSVLLNFLAGEPCRPLLHDFTEGIGIPWMAPLKDIPGREVSLYATLCRPGYEPGLGSYSRDAFREDLETRLNEYSDHHPATPYALVHLGEELVPYEHSSGHNRRVGPGYRGPDVSGCLNGKRSGGLPYGI
jgi:tRNA(Ile)-lysidine synthase TilS/MesJ